MGTTTIKRLPETVRNTVRSGIVLFDLTRVVEELVFNSLDADATKVLVYVGVGNCSVKVVDDGYGVSRDGLVLLGERYATSKLHHLTDMDAASGTFGFRGEALASISNVSLLEVITKAYGRPNGYRKVMKGSKCLYLGIDDNRKDVGTTVVVRDLFYNQPVRRKYMQSSPKKVLHSVKKSVLRIALVHSKVSFKVFDTESEVELLSTHSSSSPLSLLMSGFGIEDSSFLHELNANDGVLKISGYVSSPLDSFPIKAFQYVYINSRFTCKGPIHKLLNHLATSFESLDSLKANSGSKKGKRSRSQACPAYFVNLNCPRSLYDLTFEPTKTYVVFKDWKPILAFVEKAIQVIWMKNITYGESYSHAAEILEKDDIWKKGDNILSAKDYCDVDFRTNEIWQKSDSILSAKGDFFDADNLLENAELEIKSSRFQNHQASIHIPSSPLEKLIKEGNNLYDGECERYTFREFQEDTAELKKENHEMEFVCQPDYSLRSLDVSVSECLPRMPWKIDNPSWTTDTIISSKDSYFLENRFSAAGRSNIHVQSPELREVYRKSESGVSNGQSGSALSFDTDELKIGLELSKDFEKPFLQSCSSRGSPPFDGALFAGEEDKDEFNNELQLSKDIEVPFLGRCSSRGRLPFGGELFAGEEGYESPIGNFEPKRKRICPNERVEILGADVRNQNFDFFSKTPRRDEASCAHNLPRLMTKGSLLSDFDLLSRASFKPFPSYADPLTEETTFLSDSGVPVVKSGSGYHSVNSRSGSVISDPFFQAASWDVGHFTDKNAHEGSPRLHRGANSGQLIDSGEDYKFSYDTMAKSSNKEKCTSSCSNTGLDFKDYDGSSKEFLPEHILPKKFFKEHSDLLLDEADWLCSISCGKDDAGINKYESRRYLFRYQNYEQNPIAKQRSIRSQSAPPFHRPKRRFISLNHCSTIEAAKPKKHTLFSPEAGALKHLQQPSDSCHRNVEPCSEDTLVFGTRSDMKKSDTTLDMKKTQKAEHCQQSQRAQAHQACQVEDLFSKEIPDSIDSGTKWRNNCPQTTYSNRSCASNNQDSILNISSGLLHLAGGSLIPESINKKCLEHAKVLQQVDKKYIVVVAGGTLAVIDQHAADERIRLEELRQKVLFGEAKTVTYLDAEQELVLPEIGYQLLHNYAEQIKEWGWVCSIHTQGSRSFKKNLNILHQQSTVATLLAVPCILGVNLSDVDLLEFLQQLADTDGSSTVPPSVLRVLNFKACRGAIMFGDSLLPSECSLIVEELKQTSLCFQCAHGRPTTVPLVNMESLHKQIARLRTWNDNSSELWRGLRRQEVSLERASQRLNAARG